jgi:ATP-dependent DNA helicase RecQ
LSTLHGAKGMEFSHVLIADGGWSHKQQAADEERRVFYVGMTRARETLTLMEIHGGDHPHRRSIEGDWLMAIQPRVATPAPDIVARRYTQLTLADLDLDFAGRCAADARIHGHLAALSAGDSLDCGIHDGRVSLLDRQGNPVARLSGAAAAEWGPRLGCIDRVRILAMLRRDRRQSKSGFSERCRAEQWEVPLAEIQWR